MGENVETCDFGQKWASVGKCSTIGTLTRVTPETPENGLTMGENVETCDFGQIWESNGKRSTTGMLPRVAAETPENGLAMGKNMETGDYGQKGLASENAPRHVR
jgi:hypothetical protein